MKKPYKVTVSGSFTVEAATLKEAHYLAERCVIGKDGIDLQIDTIERY